MVRKIKYNKKIQINSEKYILILLLSGYMAGICAGCFFIFKSTENAVFADYVFKTGYLKSITLFPVALILKYSGILSGTICTITIFCGIHNSLFYCKNILNNQNKILYTTVVTVLKDTAVLMLLILYITLIINQICNKKYNIKKDIKYFIVYFCGASVIILMEYVLTTFIF